MKIHTKMDDSETLAIQKLKCSTYPIKKNSPNVYEHSNGIDQRPKGVSCN